MSQTLTIAWDSLRIEGESILVDAHDVGPRDGARIMAIIPRKTLDKAGESTLHVHVERAGGMRGWLEGAIRARYGVDQAGGKILCQAGEAPYRMTVQVEDFIGPRGPAPRP
ncbi:hypothetical protein BH10PSE12_BH10PSE12_01420 [soil metagenome]